MSSSLDFSSESGCSTEASDANSPPVCSLVRELRGLEEDSWRGQDVTVPNVPLSFVHVKLLGVCRVLVSFVVTTVHYNVLSLPVKVFGRHCRFFLLGLCDYSLATFTTCYHGNHQWKTVSNAGWVHQENVRTGTTLAGGEKHMQ